MKKTSNDSHEEPRRAMLCIAWGQEHLDHAISSAQSIAFMNIPVILYTDFETSSLVPDDAPFHSVVTVDMSEYNHLAKFYVMDNLPAEFDSFVYMDVDTRVVKDIRFGFEMAELHGLAMSPASHYSLDHFHGFGRVMEHADVALCGQYLYNAGVIFFSRRDDVMNVLRTWKRIAFELIAETGYKKTDQPFLTLAMEMLQFNPYTLAPTYNYRALIGEHISGDVLLWHSYHPVPTDINSPDRTWHRGFCGTRRIVTGNRRSPVRRGRVAAFLRNIGMLFF